MNPTKGDSVKQVIVRVKTENGMAVARTAGKTDQRYLTMEAAVEAVTAWLHGIGQTQNLIGIIDIEEG